MGFAKEAVISQLVNMFLCLLILGTGIWVYYEDNFANNHQNDQVELFISKGTLVGAEDDELLRRGLLREMDFLLASLWIYGFVLFFSLIHFFLCFVIRNIQYRKTFNICFHLGASLCILIGTICFGISFGTNNDALDELFRDLVGKGSEESGRIRNPCYFPPPPTEQDFNLGERECQERFTKVTVMCVASLNIFFCWITAYFIGCFVDVDDSAELLYAELASELPPLRNLSSLPPLPYYARPLNQSPTSKRRDRRINRVEVAA